mmetsp:Transcript_15051/g.50502  ORF Transcript_15051/g.50502 Transcript_15051/m.50502 type:complete len:156 (+) Transcript_15051:276-743(+)
MSQVLRRDRSASTKLRMSCPVNQHAADASAGTPAKRCCATVAENVTARRGPRAFGAASESAASMPTPMLRSRRTAASAVHAGARASLRMLFRFGVGSDGDCCDGTGCIWHMRQTISGLRRRGLNRERGLGLGCAAVSVSDLERLHPRASRATKGF